MRSAILAGAALGVAGSNFKTKDPWAAFSEFKERFHLVFETQAEDAKRFQIFKENMKVAEELSKKEPNAQYGATKFSHLTKEEFKKRLGFKPKANRKKYPKKTYPKVKNGSIDWRDLGGVTPVKDQGQCGSCWAFSATEAVEMGYWKTTGELQILSPQQIVSCDRGDGACNGGDTTTAYDYVQQAGGIEPEDQYPYVSGNTERRGTCKADQSQFTVQVDSVNVVSQDPYGEEDMYSAIMNSGMSICVDASSWQLYMGGVVTSETCGTELDHCVYLSGIKSGEYWIVKNSWNTDWGEEGYIRVKTGQNACGIAMEATTVEASAEAPFKKEKKDSPIPTQEILDIIAGVSEGFGVKMEEECVGDAENLFDKMKKAVELLLKKTPVDIMEAMRIVSEALEKEWPAAVKTCGGTAEELVKIFGALHILAHPKAFAYHVGHDLVINGVDIYNHINAAIGQFKDQKYHDFGYSVGKAMSELLIGQEESQVYV